jgi:hypothetical protein
MLVILAGAILTYVVLFSVQSFWPQLTMSNELTFATVVVGGFSSYLFRKIYLNVVVGTCSCYCGPGKCECTCGCREKCECYYRNKEEYFNKKRSRGGPG